MVAVVLGSAIGLASAVVWYGVNAVAGRNSPAGPPEIGVVVVLIAGAVAYGALFGALVGAVSAAVLPDSGRPGVGRRAAFVLLSCLIMAVALIGVKVILDVPLLLLAVPAALFVLALVFYLRRILAI